MSLGVSVCLRDSLKCYQPTLRCLLEEQQSGTVGPLCSAIPSLCDNSLAIFFSWLPSFQLIHKTWHTSSLTRLNQTDADAKFTHFTFELVTRSEEVHGRSSLPLSSLLPKVFHASVCAFKHMDECVCGKTSAWQSGS